MLLAQLMGRWGQKMAVNSQKSAKARRVYENLTRFFWVLE
jgi:hypothetical protein